MAYSKLAYVAIKKQTTDAAVKPDTYVEFFEVSANANYETLFMDVAANTSAKTYRAVSGKNGAPSGTISIPAQSRTAGHFLLAAYGAVNTTGPNADGMYTHTVTEGGSPPDYTMDIGIVSEQTAWRFGSTKFGGLESGFEDNALRFSLDWTSRYAFTVASVTTTASSGTTLVLSSTFGLTTSDTIVVSKGDTTNQAEYTISSINADGVTLTLGSSITGKTHTAGDLVVIKSSTPSYSVGSQFVGIGGTTFKIGPTLGTVEEDDAEDWTFNFTREYEPRHALRGPDEEGRWPAIILAKGYEASTTWTRYYNDPQWINHLRARNPLAIEVTSRGNLIAGTSYDSITFQLPHIRLEGELPSMGSDEIVDNDWTGTAVYDSTAGYVTRVILTNTQASY